MEYCGHALISQQRTDHALVRLLHAWPGGGSASRTRARGPARCRTPRTPSFLPHWSLFGQVHVSHPVLYTARQEQGALRNCVAGCALENVRLLCALPVGRARASSCQLSDTRRRGRDREGLEYIMEENSARKELSLNIIVIGCGVSGLTSALCLLEAGHRVSIWAKDRPPDTTSNIASAIWLPFKAYPAERVMAWGEIALRKFAVLRQIQESGVFLADFLEVTPQAHPQEPVWARAVQGFRQARADELPAGYPGGHVFQAPVIDTRIYLDYLVHQVSAQGGEILTRTLSSLAEAFAHSTVVVNCSGLGARTLVGDQDLHPARGQAIRIKHTGFRRVLLDEEGPNQLAYIVPRTHDIVLGGTFQEHNWSTAIHPQETLDILQRIARLAPAFAAITPDEIEQVICGLRPVRSTVRVEAERLSPDRFLVHNYGHGGAGITLSWGCAAEVVALVAQMAADQ